MERSNDKFCTDLPVEDESGEKKKTEENTGNVEEKKGVSGGDERKILAEQSKATTEPNNSTDKTPITDDTNNPVAGINSGAIAPSSTNFMSSASSSPSASLQLPFSYDQLLRRFDTAHSQRRKLRTCKGSIKSNKMFLKQEIILEDLRRKLLSLCVPGKRSETPSTSEEKVVSDCQDFKLVHPSNVSTIGASATDMVASASQLSSAAFAKLGYCQNVTGHGYDKLKEEGKNLCRKESDSQKKTKTDTDNNTEHEEEEDEDSD